MPTTIPQQLGRYNILQKLGEGGMGAVYLADDTRLRRRVALKVPHFDNNVDPRTIERFRREARLAAQITHPNLCPVYDVDCVDGIHFLTMAYIEGTPLSRYIAGGRPWPASHAVILLRHLASVLSLLHSQGIIHRDLKPSNVMIRHDGTPVLMDFGLARSMDAATQLTTQGKIMGTPSFMAPEQIQGDERLIGPHTDIWALGVMLYQLITGELPFKADSAMEVWSRILYTQMPPPSMLVAGLDPRLDEICTRVLAKDPRQRPATMTELAQLLAALDTSMPLPAPPPPPASPERTDQRTIQEQFIPTLSHPRPRPRPRAGVPWLGIGAAVLATSLLVAVGVLFWLGVFAPTKASQQASATKASNTATQRAIRLGALEELTVRAGDRVEMPIEIERRGWDGDVSLVQVDSPNELEVTLTAIPRGQTTGRVRVRAVKEAVPGRHIIRLRAFANDGTYAEESLYVMIQPAAVASLRLTLPEEISITAGQSQTVYISVDRINCEGEVKLLQDSQADGISLKLNPIAREANRVNILIQTQPIAKPGLHTITLLARLPGQADTEGMLKVRVKPGAVAFGNKFTNSIGMQLTLIPRGKYTMGASKADRESTETFYKSIGLTEDQFKHWLDSEQPQHEVEITNAFYIGVYEVTQSEYEKVMKYNPSAFQKGGTHENDVQGLDTKRFPVETVSWDDAVKFCETLSNLPEEKENKRAYRLPTEAEWEYACRGNSRTYRAFHFGDTLTHNEANFDTDQPYNSADKKAKLGRPVAVDDPKYRPNVFGLYHMHGNVYEWCSDRYSGAYYQTCIDSAIVKDPQGPSDETYDKRVQRGGSWSVNGGFCRASLRNWWAPDSRGGIVGFRIVCVRVP